MLSFLFGKHLGVELPGHMLNPLRNLQIVFQSSHIILHSYQQYMSDQFLCILNSISCHYFYFSHSDWCVSDI